MLIVNKINSRCIIWYIHKIINKAMILGKYVIAIDPTDT